MFCSAGIRRLTARRQPNAGHWSPIAPLAGLSSRARRAAPQPREAALISSCVYMFGHPAEFGAVAVLADGVAAVVLVGVAAADELVAAFAITAPPPVKIPATAIVANAL